MCTYDEGIPPGAAGAMPGSDASSASRNAAAKLTAESRLRLEEEFTRDRYEVQMLLNYLSGRPDSRVTDIRIDVPADLLEIEEPVDDSVSEPVTKSAKGAMKGAMKGAPRSPSRSKAGTAFVSLSIYEALRTIHTLRYAPTGRQLDLAEASALLVCVKDTLNSCAYPARGATIAYTWMFCDERRMPAADAALRSYVAALFGLSAKDDNIPAGRADLARAAYPGLIPSAQRMRSRHQRNISICMVTTILSIALFALVAYGVQITAKFESDRAALKFATRQIYDEFDHETELKNVGDRHPPPTFVICRVAADKSNEVRRLCDDWAYSQARYDVSVSDATVFAKAFVPKILTDLFPAAYTTSGWKPWCNPYDFKDAKCKGTPDIPATWRGGDADAPAVTNAVSRTSNLLKVGDRTDTEADVQNAKTETGDSMAAKDDTRESKSDQKSQKSDSNSSNGSNGSNDDLTDPLPQEVIQSLTLVLSACATYVLPILFGMVGAIASALRDIVRKATLFQLSPRDEAYMIVRIPLGLVAGVAISLFFTPGGTAEQVATGAGVLTLTASGLAFITGYASEHFFKLVDAMADRLFQLNAPERHVPRSA